MPAGKFYRYKPKMKYKKRPSAAKNARRINTMIRNVEIKDLYDGSSISQRTNSTHSFTLNEIQQGTSDQARIGEKIKLLNLTISLYLELFSPELEGTETSTPWTLTGTTADIRIMLIKVVQNNNVATFTSTEIFHNSSTTIQMLNSMYNKDFVGRGKKYRILYDKYFTISNLSGSPSKRKINIFKKLGIDAIYTANNGDGADILKNRIDLLFVTASNEMNVGYRSLIRFKDY